jgi:hypothetical protein
MPLVERIEDGTFGSYVVTTPRWAIVISSCDISFYGGISSCFTKNYDCQHDGKHMCSGGLNKVPLLPLKSPLKKYGKQCR